jgi:hypothetical protein
MLYEGLSKMLIGEAMGASGPYHSCWGKSFNSEGQRKTFTGASTNTDATKKLNKYSLFA